MSAWTYIDGVITVEALGRTQAEKTYILQTVLEHLPKVTGSEEDMCVKLVQVNGYSQSENVDEFGQCSNLIPLNAWGHRYMHVQSTYMIVVHGTLRDRSFETTLKEFSKWLNRLAKRVMTTEVLVKVSDKWCHTHIFTGENNAYLDMFESLSDEDANTPYAWCEYLMWDCGDDGMPAKLQQRYKCMQPEVEMRK